MDRPGRGPARPMRQRSAVRGTRTRARAVTIGCDDSCGGVYPVHGTRVCGAPGQNAHQVSGAEWNVAEVADALMWTINWRNAWRTNSTTKWTPTPRTKKK